MSQTDKDIIRSWSVLVARGDEGTAAEVAAYADLDEADVARRMAALRAQGALP